MTCCMPRTTPPRGRGYSGGSTAVTHLPVEVTASPRERLSRATRGQTHGVPFWPARTETGVGRGPPVSLWTTSRRRGRRHDHDCFAVAKQSSPEPTPRRPVVVQSRSRSGVRRRAAIPRKQRRARARPRRRARNGAGKSSPTEVERRGPERAHLAGWRMWSASWSRVTAVSSTSPAPVPRAFFRCLGSRRELRYRTPRSLRIRLLAHTQNRPRRG